MMLQNACIRYDKTLKQKPSTSSRAVYQHELDHYSSVHDKVDDHLDKTFAPDGIDTSSNDIYNVNNTNFKRSPHVISSRIYICFGTIYTILLVKPKNHPFPGTHSLFCFQINSVISPGKNSWHGDLKTPIIIQALYLVLDTEDIPS